jgi:hypothetical protein
MVELLSCTGACVHLRRPATARRSDQATDGTMVGFHWRFDETKLQPGIRRTGVPLRRGPWLGRWTGPLLACCYMAYGRHLDWPPAIRAVLVSAHIFFCFSPHVSLPFASFTNWLLVLVVVSDPCTHHHTMHTVLAIRLVSTPFPFPLIVLASALFYVVQSSSNAAKRWQQSAGISLLVLIMRRGCFNTA